MKNIKNTFKKDSILLLIPLLFLIDLIFLEIFSKPLLQTLLCFFVVYNFHRSYYKLFYGAFFLVLEYMLLDGSYLIPFCFFFMIGLIIYSTNQYLNLSYQGLPYLGLILIIIAKNTLLNPWTFSASFGYYTWEEISVNIIILFGILKLTSRGKLGNRL